MDDHSSVAITRTEELIFILLLGFSFGDFSLLVFCLKLEEVQGHQKDWRTSL